MKKEILNYRYYVLGVLFSISMIFVLGQEDESMSMLKWFGRVIADKTFGLGVGYAAYRLLVFWDAKDKIPFLSKLAEEDE